jgi:hypothetical protein
VSGVGDGREEGVHHCARSACLGARYERAQDIALGGGNLLSL